MSKIQALVSLLVMVIVIGTGCSSSSVMRDFHSTGISGTHCDNSFRGETDLLGVHHDVEKLNIVTEGAVGRTTDKSISRHNSFSIFGMLGSILGPMNITVVEPYMETSGCAPGICTYYGGYGYAGGGGGGQYGYNGGGGQYGYGCQHYPGQAPQQPQQR